MLYRAAADLLVIIHLLFIVYVLVGGWVSFRWPWASVAHVPAVVWAATVEITGGICPLTPLEVTLRRHAGEQGYTGGFIEHYLYAILYPDELSRSMQLAFGGFVIMVNVAAYALLLHRAYRGRA